MNGNLVYALKSIIILISNAVEKKMYFDIQNLQNHITPALALEYFPTLLSHSV